LAATGGSDASAEHRRTARALEESEARFRRLAENAHDYIYRFELHPHRHFSYCSPAVTRMFGYTPEEFYADPDLPLKIVVADDIPLTASVLSGERVDEEATLRIRRKDGRIVWAEFRRVAIHDDAGALVAVEAIVRDVTDRKRAEDGQRFLAEAGELLAGTLDEQTALTNLARLAVPALADWCTVDVVQPDGTTVALGGSHVDPEREGLIRELQRRYPPAPGGTRPISRVLRSGQSLLLEAVSDADLEASSPDAGQWQLRRALGFRSAMFVPLRGRDRLLGIITLVAADDWRRYGPADLALAEELARRAALAVENARLYREAQEAIQKRDEFLSVAAHELKTPITSLRGFAQLLARRLDQGRALPPDQLRYAIATIELQSGKLAHLIAQLLTVTRLDAGKLSLDREPADLAHLVRRAVEAAQATTTRHTFTVTGPPRAPASVDSVRLEQVLANLFANAIKYSPDGGAIDVAVVVENATVQISVADRGVGVVPAQREHIFDRFYQAPDDQAGGMGLGLYISRQIVELHGGRLDMAPRPGGGSCFVLTVPR
jgi:PAS domain S-box-containing protein